jgi:hypothetical protein
MEKLIIFQKSYDCFLYLHIAIKNFPKSEKFVLAADIKNTFFDMLMLFITANKLQDRRKILIEADVKLDILRFQLRVAKDLQFLKLKQYEILAANLSEIGKMLGGWIKSTK